MSLAGSSSFGTLLRELRTAAGLSQEELAQRANVGKDTVGGLERGSRKYPYAPTVARLTTALALQTGDRARLEEAARRPGRPRRARIEGSTDECEAPRTNLRPERTSLIGREAVLAEVATLLASHRLVTLVGTGGVGKTRIAREVGAALVGECEDGVWLVELAPLRDERLICEQIAAAIGMTTTEGAGLAQLQSYLERRSMLLVLDNCEHLIEEVARVLDGLMCSCERLRFLVTSRERVRLPGERAYRIPSLSSPERIEETAPADLLRFESIAMFVDRARAADASFVLNAETIALVAVICRRLDGIPLALELAASRIDSFGVADIVERLDRRFRLLTTGYRTAPPRHRTMRALIEWSYDLLTPAERLLFDRTACFAAGWSPDAAGVVCAFGDLAACDITLLLGSLVEKSMVAMSVSDGRARYRLLESTRAYAFEQLTSRGEQQLVERRLAYWLAEFADRSKKALHTTPRAEWLAPMVMELDNARIVLEWALVRARDVSIAARVVAAYRSYWADSGHLAEGLQWLARLRDVLGPEVSAADEAAFWLSKSILTTGTHVVEAAQESITRFEGLGDYEGLAIGYLRLGVGYRQMASFERAESAIARALACFERAGLTKSIMYASALGWKASALVGLERRAEAREAFGACIALDEALGDGERAAVERLNLAELEFADGNVPAALAETEATLRTLGGNHHSAALVAELNAAAYRIFLGDYVAARESAVRACRLARRVGYRLWKATAVQHLATLLALEGDAARAARLSGFAEACYVAEGAAREPTETRTYRILCASLSERLTPAERCRFERAGSTLGDDEALDLALAQPPTGRMRVRARA